jgi:enterochelin esterase family protein
MRPAPAIATAALLAAAAAALPAQGPPPPPVVSPEVSAERKVIFRVRAPGAEEVRLSSSDLPGVGRGVEMTKGDGDVWQVEHGPVLAGAYRYRFDIDGVQVSDPSNPATSESNMNSWSLVYVPGSDDWDTRDVPHGAVAEVTYQSDSLGRARRMHVYTPPGYESGEGEFPVLYLLHGAFDCDDSWTSVGRAGFVLDNLIARGDAVPMVVVMPMGHTGPFQFGAPGGFEKQMEEFADDFAQDVRPYVESHYRVKKDRANRALAGLSMGGAQTLAIAAADLGSYGHLGVFSSGVFGIDRGGSTWEADHAAALDDASLKEGLKHFWFATGNEDFLVETSRATVEMLKKHGFEVTYEETGGGHTWLNWREYLRDFSQLLFK